MSYALFKNGRRNSSLEYQTKKIARRTVRLFGGLDKNDKCIKGWSIRKIDATQKIRATTTGRGE